MRRGDWYQTDKIVQKVCVHFRYSWAACVSAMQSNSVFRNLDSIGPLDMQRN